MNIREALQQQSPSLTLQRAAADEIARLDAVVVRYQAEVVELVRNGEFQDGQGIVLTQDVEALENIK